MARRPNPTPEAAPDGTTTEVLDAKGKALAVHSQLASDVAHAYGDGDPYERNRVIGQARVLMATSAEAMLELGKCLIQIKENEAHGDFTEIVVGRLGIPERTARRFMSAALKFLAPGRKTATLAVLGKSKLFELMDESGEDLDALAEGGTVAGLELDEIQAMSARELRAALLDERKKTAAKDRVIAGKDSKLNKLAELEELRRNGTPDEREQAQLAELRDVGLEAEQTLQRLAAVADATMREPATEAAELAARQTIDYVVQRLADALAARGIAVDLMGDRIDPAWAKSITDAAASGKGKARRA
jgi:hypothetical protein